jgi:hypothetical protein
VPADVHLWPVDRALVAAGQAAPRYIVHVRHPKWIPFYGSVPSGPSPLTWLEFRSLSTPLTATEISALAVYMTATDARLAALEARSAAAYTHTQSSASAIWTINHNLGFRPTVTLLDDGGQQYFARVDHPAANQTVVTHLTPTTGSARLT